MLINTGWREDVRRQTSEGCIPTKSRGFRCLRRHFVMQRSRHHNPQPEGLPNLKTFGPEGPLNVRTFIAQGAVNPGPQSSPDYAIIHTYCSATGWGGLGIIQVFSSFP